MEQAAAAEAELQQRLAACQQRHQQATEARHRLSRDYHPIDLETGRPREAEEVGQLLKQNLDQLDEIAAAAGLSAPARQKSIQGPPRPAGDATHDRVLLGDGGGPAGVLGVAGGGHQVDAGGVDSGPVSGHRGREGVDGRRTSPAAGTGGGGLGPARSPDGPWGSLNDHERADLEAKARQCAELFQRSSSCVEGRNGQLSLRHHGLHRLTPRKLGALKVIHNYLVERPDGSTAAERFFGSRPQPLFAWLLARLPLPARPYQCHRQA